MFLLVKLPNSVPLGVPILPSPLFAPGLTMRISAQLCQTCLVQTAGDGDEQRYNKANRADPTAVNKNGDAHGKKMMILSTKCELMMINGDSMVIQSWDSMAINGILW